MTDEEIGLIKTMLRRGLRQDVIHFHFNRADRLISSGRIAQIHSGKYGPNIPAADDDVLDRFLAEFQRRVGAQFTAVTSEDGGVQSLFKEVDKEWYFTAGETDNTECKKSFRLAPDTRFADVIKSIAGMANNKGGYIFFGVRDGTFVVEGLSGEEFSKEDPANINRTLASALDPVPHVIKSVIRIGYYNVGVLTIKRHENAPVVALKNIGNDVKEGAIYFRYVGETRAIKPGELRQIIAAREQRAVAEFSRRMVGVAAGTQATLDLETGEVKGTTGAFLIDQALLPQLQFIREGDFSEIKGAPALRLIGDVQPIDNEARKKAQIIRDAVTPDAIIRNFLKAEVVAEPLQYVIAQIHCQRKWLPLWYYVSRTGRTVEVLSEELRSQVATYPSSRNTILNRLEMKLSAYKKHSGKPAEMLKKIVDGEEVTAGSEREGLALANAVMGLPDDFSGSENLRGVLLAALNCTPESSAARSAIYRASCRLDEILYALRR